MKRKFGVYLVGLVLVGLGVAAIATNPNPVAYNEYATLKLTEYLQEQECTTASETVRNLCELLDQKPVQNQIGELIADNTERQYWLFFSIYKTNLSPRELLPSFLNNFVSLPSYRFETIGGFNNFQTYQAERLSP